MYQKKKNTGLRAGMFYIVIAFLTATIAIAGSVPYILNRMSGRSTEKTSRTETIHVYGRPSLDGKEMRGVWVAFLSLDGVDRQMIDEIMAKAKANGLNTVFFHVRPFGDALYRSDYYPWSHLVTGTQGVAPADGFDPLAYAVEAAHREGLTLHAWLNPLRIMHPNGEYPPALSEDNPYTVWRNDGNPENDGWVIDHGKGKYYNPAVPEVRELIVNGVREIVERYNVDGIHWDDYFYPAEDESFDDSASYAAYREQGGAMSLTEWRTDNINRLVRGVYSAVKAARSDCVFGISPAGNIENCLSVGADVIKWGSEAGYVDYLLPQIYWTNDHSVCPFEPTCRRWDGLVTNPDVRLYIGLALYKAGTDSDKGKWKKSDDIIMKQVQFTRNGETKAAGFSLYSYAYLDSEATTEEMKHLRSVLG